MKKIIFLLLVLMSLSIKGQTIWPNIYYPNNNINIIYSIPIDNYRIWYNDNSYIIYPYYNNNICVGYTYIPTLFFSEKQIQKLLEKYKKTKEDWERELKKFTPPPPKEIIIYKSYKTI